MVRGIFKWRVLITKRIGGACLLRDVCEYGRLSGDAIQMVYIKKNKGHDFSSILWSWVSRVKQLSRVLRRNLFQKMRSSNRSRSETCSLEFCEAVYRGRGTTRDR